MNAAPIEFYFDPVSPFSYLATTQIDQLAARHGRTVDWHPVLIGITVLKVMGLKPVPATPLKSTYMWTDVCRQAGMLDVPLRHHGLKDVNSVAACRAFLWLREREPALARTFVKRLSARLWAEGGDITDVAVVLDMAEGVGADRAALKEALHGAPLKAALKDAVDRAIERGVFGVPFFFVDGEPLWGVDRLWMLDHRLAAGEWPRLRF